MSRENVEVVRALWPHEVDLVEWFVDGEVPAEVLARLASDLEVRFVANAPGVAELVYRGPEGLAEGWRNWLEPFARYWIEAEDFVDACGDEVFVPVRISARTKRDGVAVEHSPAATCTVKQRHIVRIRFYLDRRDALDAVKPAGRFAALRWKIRLRRHGQVLEAVGLSE